MIKLRRVRWPEHVAGMRGKRSAYKILVENMKRRDRLEDAGVDGRKILQCTLRK
jgi:hypothetical protein